MPRIEMTPLTITIFILLFAVAVGTLVMNWSGLEISDEGASVEQTAQPSTCDPISALKIRYVNDEITDEQYMTMKQKLEEDQVK